MGINQAAALGICGVFITGLCILVGQVALPQLTVPGPGAESGGMAAAQRAGRMQFRYPSMLEREAAARRQLGQVLAATALPEAEVDARPVFLPPLVSRQAEPVEELEDGVSAVEAAEPPAGAVPVLAAVAFSPCPSTGREATTEAATAPQSTHDRAVQVSMVPTELPGVYRVKKGDNLASVARQVFGSAEPALVRRLIEANPKLKRRPNLLYVGETLRIPGASAAVAVESASAAAGQVGQQKSAAASQQPPKTGGARVATPNRDEADRSVRNGPAGRQPNIALDGSGRYSKERGAAARRRLEQKNAQRWYTIRANESLADIAGKELGNPRRWREIAELNGLRNPDRVNAGRRIRLPADGQPASQG